ncbi:MAG: hypothetical protein ACI4D7_12765, partial [Lachnospiraceae bacterium]
MKKISLVFLLCMCFTITAEAYDDSYYIPEDNWPEAPEITAPTAVLMDAESGMVLYAKNADARRFPASITKLMTALLTIEDSSLDEQMVFEKEALGTLPPGYVSIYASEGEVMSVRECLYALLLPSANDAANGLAVHDAGTIAAFAEKMNQRAVEAGATGTHFVNPSGLADPDHYTTAHDMSLILRQCIRYPEFLEIAGTVKHTIPATNKSAARYVDLTHQMLKKTSPYYYEYAVAGKTGNTTESGRTLVTYAKKGNMELICCVMQCEDGEQFLSTKALFEYGFQNFEVLSDRKVEQDIGSVKTEDTAFRFMEGSRKFRLQLTDTELVKPASVSLDELDTKIVYLNPTEEENGCFAELQYFMGDKQLGSSKVKMEILNEVVAGGKIIPQNSSPLHNPDFMLFLICIAGIITTLWIGWMAAVKDIRKNRQEKENEAAEEAVSEEVSEETGDNTAETEKDDAEEAETEKEGAEEAATEKEGAEAAEKIDNAEDEKPEEKD